MTRCAKVDDDSKAMLVLRATHSLIQCQALLWGDFYVFLLILQRAFCMLACWRVCVICLCVCVCVLGVLDGVGVYWGDVCWEGGGGEGFVKLSAC